MKSCADIHGPQMMPTDCSDPLSWWSSGFSSNAAKGSKVYHEVDGYLFL